MPRRQLAQADVRVGTRIPLGASRFPKSNPDYPRDTGHLLVTHITPNRARVTVRYVSGWGSNDPGARFAGNDVRIYTWDGAGFKRGGSYLSAWVADPEEDFRATSHQRFAVTARQSGRSADRTSASRRGRTGARSRRAQRGGR